MLTILKSAASGMLAQKHNLDVIANNIANVNTTGYKKSRVNLVDAGYESVAAVLDADGQLVADLRAGTGVTPLAPRVIFSQGNLRETGNLWDLAVAGPGFFQVALPDGRQAYTRDGSFQVDAQGLVATSEGFTIDPPITIPADAEDVQIDQAGTVRALLAGDDVELGRIPLAIFPSPEQLIAVGHNLFISSEASGEAQVGDGGTGGRGQIISGVQEGSNVEMAEEMTRMLEAQRAYQLAIKALQTADEMLGLANNLRR